MKPAIVVLDYYLEDELSAKDVMEKLWDLNPKPHVILLSSITDEDEKNEVLSMGVNEFIPKKNESVYDLVKVIQNALGLDEGISSMNDENKKTSWPIWLVIGLILLAIVFGMIRTLT